MTTTRVDDATIRRTFPYPIASAWARVHRATTDAERIPRLESAVDIALRALAALALSDYLRGAPVAAVEAAIANLKRPSLGHWVQLLREALRALRERGDPPPFLAEAPGWYFDAKGRPSESARLLDEAVTVRNELRHKGGAFTPAQVKEVREDLVAKLRPVLADLAWLGGYRLFRVQSIAPTRRRTNEGKLQFFAGEQEHTDPVLAEWGHGTNLLPGVVYLVDPGATGVLEVSPFFDVLTDSRTGQEHLFLVRDAPDMKKLARAHDESGSVETQGIETEAGEVSFATWLSRREGIERYQRLEGASEAFRAVAAAAPPSPDLLGGRYEIKALLGEGGMASVYHVHDRELDEECAIKVLRVDAADGASFAERFDREGRTMKKLRHPNIVPVLDVGRLEDGRRFLKMPIVGGGSLRERIVKGGVTEPEAARVAEEALSALEYLHRMGLVHRDVKPANFLVDENGRVLLTDFGIALRTDEQRRLTKTMETVGTLQYMAPEQQRGRDVGPKADVFSLAVMLHELRTGELPHAASGQGIAGPFGALVRAMGAADPELRPTSAEALARLRGQPAPATIAPSVPPAPPSLSSPPPPVAPASAGPAHHEQHAPGEERVHEKDGTVLVWVPQGEYVQGSDETSDAKPVHRVMLSGFWIAKYPVTNRQYAAFLKATGRPPPKDWGDARYNGSEQPVVTVSWLDAMAYCDWAGLTLPTEAQWEAAARGADGRKYPWGDAAPTPACCNLDGSKIGKTTPVKTYAAGRGPFGTMDQAGNAWEWCFDAYEKDAYKKRAPGGWDPVAPGSENRASKAQRACRGGAFNSGVVVARAAFRGHEAPTIAYENTGFRCARLCTGEKR